MAFHDLLVTEIFHSLQGETSFAGVPFSFIRLTGCNLRCTYCDSAYAFKGGKVFTLSEILRAIEPHQTKHVLITGGEPLLQRQTLALVHALREKKYQVSIETHGEVSIAKVAPLARIIMDIKTPSSGMCREGFQKNLKHLKPTDEIKFVIASKNDYVWAKNEVQKIQTLNCPTDEILFSPAVSAENQPGKFEGVEPRWLAEQILEDRLPVRFQLQLHKQLWGQNRRGV